MSDLPASIHERGRAAVLGGGALLDVPPGPGSSRWGLSLVLRPDDEAAAHLDALAGEAAAVAGPGQWLTGGLTSSHLTVTYLERTWREVTGDDPDVRRYADLVGRLATTTPPLRFAVNRLVLADQGVLALAVPLDAAAPSFRAAVLAELGGLGTEEQGYRGSTWWATLLHFAAPVVDPAGLVAWVEEPRFAAFPLTADLVQVVRYVHDGNRTMPVPLGSAACTGVREGALDGAQT